MRSWLSAAGLATILFALVAPVSAQESGATAAEQTPPRAVAPPPAPAPGSGRVRLRLVKASEKKDTAVDDTAWLRANGLSLPELKVPNPGMGVAGELPEGVPVQYEGAILVRAIRSNDRLLLVYGPDFASGRYVVAWDEKAKAPRYALDFASFAAPTPGGGVTPLPVIFAWEDIDGTLYVSTGINGYASEVQGRTAYVTALEPKTGKVRWRSQPLVANAGNFALVGDAVVAGYGFTDEKDYLYLLDKRTGRTATRIALGSAPDYILRKGNRVYVRTYDRNYVFTIR